MRFTVSHFEEDIEKAVVIGTYATKEEMIATMVSILMKDVTMQERYATRKAHLKDMTFIEFIEYQVYFGDIDHYIIEDDTDVSEWFYVWD